MSVAVGLVTLIAQRDDRASTNTDIRLYYGGALAYEVVGSSVVVHALGFERSDLFAGAPTRHQAPLLRFLILLTAQSAEGG